MHIKASAKQKAKAIVISSPIKRSPRAGRSRRKHGADCSSLDHIVVVVVFCAQVKSRIEVVAKSLLRAIDRPTSSVVDRVELTRWLFDLRREARTMDTKVRQAQGLAGGVRWSAGRTTCPPCRFRVTGARLEPVSPRRCYV